MLVTKNRTITVQSLTQTGEKRAFSNTITGLKVYINQTQDELVEGFDNQGSIFPHKMLTDGNHGAILIGDRITDDTGKQYDIRGKSIFKDLTGTHHQYTLVEAYD
jgi:hypothetical protein